MGTSNLQSKGVMLLSLLLKSPNEFYTRLSTIVENKKDYYANKTYQYRTVAYEQMIESLSEYLQADLKEFLQEQKCQDIRQQVAVQMNKMEQDGPFNRRHNADPTLANLCYAVCRATKPDVVIETGVAYGVTSAYILQALTVNINGILYSVDLPPLGKQADTYVGAFIPNELKQRWQLRRGASKYLLPKLLSEVQNVDLFIHDSLHTYNNMLFEFNTIMPYLKHPSIVIADDIKDNAAFGEWTGLTKPNFMATVAEKQKNGLFGINAFH